MTRETARVVVPVGLLAFLLASLLACCNRPEAPACLRAPGIDTVRIDTLGSEVTALRIEDGLEVVLRPGESASGALLHWEGPANLLAHAQMEVLDGVLELGDGNTCRWVRDLGIRLRVVITAPGVRAVDHRGTGDFRWEIGEQSGKWSFDARRYAGAAVVHAEVDTFEARLHAGPCFLALSGASDRLGIYVAGLGTVDASEFYAKRAFLNQSSAHELAFRATEYAFIDLSGSGNVRGLTIPEEWEVTQSGTGQVIWP